ncbi:MAG: ATP-dependent nuclease subunit B-like protein, partial [Solirubrobacterales bacterium]|nr:ATP-dependent nuclease subunit B-like protein [Solirubrobacterales bacterium]
MSITLITGPANAGKAQLVLDAVRREVARADEPLLVVPTRADAEHYLRELAGDGAAIGVRVERFAGLLSEIVVRAGIADAVLGGLARDRLLQALLAESWLEGEDATSGRAGGRGFVRALGELFCELQARRVAPARFERALERVRVAEGLAGQRSQLGTAYASYRA